MRRLLAILTTALATVALVAATLPADSAEVTAPDQRRKPLRDVMFVGNNWAGTATVVDAHSAARCSRRGIDLIPDKEQELADIYANPERLAFYIAIQQGPGEGHDQYVDDMFTTSDGRCLAVCRPSFGDVVWIDIAKAAAGDPDSIVREQQMDGYRTDHMGLSPDGRRLLVSDSTERQVIEFSMVDETLRRRHAGEHGPAAAHLRVRRDAAREQLHRRRQADLPRVDRQGLHPGRHRRWPDPDRPGHDALKGDRWFQIVAQRDFHVTQRWDMGKELAEAGYAGHELGGAADGDRAGRAVRLLPGVLLPRLRRVRHPGRRTSTAPSTTPPAPRRAAHAARSRALVPLPNRVPNMPLRAVRQRLRPPRALDQRRRARRCASPARWTTTPRWSTASTGHARSSTPQTTGHDYLKPYWTTEGLGRHLLDLAERRRLGRGARLHDAAGGGLPRGRRPPAAGPARRAADQADRAPGDLPDVNRTP